MKDRELAQTLSKQSGRMVPLAFEQHMVSWFKTNGKRLSTFAGSEAEARKIMAGLFYAASRVPKLMECSLESLGDCLMQSAQTGMYPGALHECAYLPFKGRATFVPMFGGLVKLAYGSGYVRDIQTDVVYDGDSFEYEKGTIPSVRHVPVLNDRLRGDRKAVYCIVSTTTGGKVFDVKDMEWVEGIKARSPSARFDDSPWQNFYDEMAKKSILKSTLKLVPKSAKLQHAIDLDNEAEGQPLKPVIIPLSDPEEVLDSTIPE